ncbi:MAG TPA: 2-amino-4-hydroxy-6-hydroxymethyldihydropteridine diphosphokinase [Anaerolineales bacterium]|nr:2-amino-4-hydroxy-6-hydroxymethyldihydropteridine diphosphokinase [Anaerolineales bacterium]
MTARPGHSALGKRPAYVALGSNMEAERNLPRAVLALRRLGEVRSISHVYESEAVGPAGQPRFLNAVVRLEAADGVDDLRIKLRQVEADMGRVRTSDKFAPRPIDLDLVAADDFIDADLAARAYLAVTLAEVAPDLMFDATGESVAARAEMLRSTSELRPRPDVDRSIAKALQR